MATTIASKPRHLLQSDIQCPPQVQASITPAPGHSSSTSATVPQGTISTPLPPPPEDNDIAIDASAEKKLHGKRLRALRTFGHIPDVPIFSSWDKRKECSASAVHRSIMAGICGNKKDGVFSIALSGRYADNEDGGDIVIYTGAGGRPRWTETLPPKRIRFGPQTQDQSWDTPYNEALMVSSRTGNPVRVIRSHMCCSKYAPVTGYRYDGLYKVTTYWTSTGKNGKVICRCRLERLPGQPPIPVRPLTLPTKRGQRLVSRTRHSPPQLDNSHDLSVEMPVDVDVQSIQSYPSPPPSMMPELNELVMSELNSDAGQPKPRSPQRPAPSYTSPDTLPRYRWDPKTNRLARLPPVEDLGAEGEDDATLVPDEEGVSTSDIGYLSDMNHPDVPHPSSP